MILLTKRKKIVLFIVEGITDEVSLALGFSELMNSNEVRFELTHGDITTRDSIQVNTVASEVGKIVKKFMGRIYRKADILKVIHIVDTDGCFISDDNVVHEDTDITYTDEVIKCRNEEDIRRRNAHKSEVLQRMSMLGKVLKDIDYSVYFMSCNLDHVLHNDANPTNDQKNDYADEFRDRYQDDIEGFVQFFNDEEYACVGTYKETWDFIQRDTNSLKRHTNINILINTELNSYEKE